MSKIEVCLLTKDLEKDWDAFVDSSNNGTMFHKIKFLEYHPKDRFQFFNLMFYKKGKIVALLPGAKSGEMFRSPTGSSLGGFVTKSDIGIKDADAIVKEFIRFCPSANIKEVFLTPPMQVYNKTFNEAIEYSLHYNHFPVLSSLYSSVADLYAVKGIDDLDSNSRRNINKAIKNGIVIKESDNFDEFYPILLKNKSKFEVKPTHTLDELKKINQLLPGSIKLFMAYKDNTAIAGELLFIANKSCVLNFYSMHLYEFRNLYPLSALVAYALAWASKSGFHYFDYGVSADTFSHDPMEPSWSLVKFKESMGFAGCQRKTYYRRIF